MEPAPPNLPRIDLGVGGVLGDGRAAGKFPPPSHLTDPARRERLPSPQCLHDWGRFQETAEDSRGVDSNDKRRSPNELDR